MTMLYKLESSEDGLISLAKKASAGNEVSSWTRGSANARKWLSTSGDSGLPKAVIVFTFPKLQPAPQRARLDPEEGSNPRGMAAASLTRREAT